MQQVNATESALMAYCCWVALKDINTKDLRGVQGWRWSASTDLYATVKKMSIT